MCQVPQDEGDFAQATCVQATSCEELECDPGFVCQEFTLEESGDGENSGDASSGSGVLPSTVPPSPSVTRQPTDASASGSGSTSVISVSTSGPVTSTSPPSLQTVARCVSNNIRASCEELECNPGFVCQEFTLEESGDAENSGDVSSGSGVLPSTVPPSPSATRQPTDASASGSGSTSVISVSTSGPVISTSPPSPQTVARCVSNNIQASCKELVCEEDQVCSLVRYPSHNISVARCAGRDTVPQPQLFELGTVCEGRTVACPVGTECLEVDGNVAGTLCNTPPNVISCDNLECTSIAECVQSEVDGIPVTAFCLSSATVDTVVSSILPLLP